MSTCESDFAIDADDCKVVVRSVKRLVFEPKGWMLDLRREMRQAIRGLRIPGSSEILDCCYTSPDRSPCDVENILCYNVGLQAFAQGARQSIVLQREFAAVPMGPHQHVYRYSITSKTSAAKAWRPSIVLAKWSFEIGGSSSASKPEQIWFRCKSGKVESEMQVAVANDLGIELNLALDKPQRSIYLLKPLVDGILAALHQYIGDDVAEVAIRIAKQLTTVSFEEVVMKLLDPHHTVMGPRRVVHRFGRGVQWNPADDRLVHLALHTRLQAGQEMKCEGRLFSCETVRSV